MHCILFTTTPRDKPALAGAAKAKRTRWIQLLGKDVLSLERTQACFEYIEGDALLEYDLPKRPSMLPGEKLKHCYDVMDKMLEAQKPCVFKVGYTHCPYFRFYNKKFGYTYDPYDKWEKWLSSTVQVKRYLLDTSKQQSFNDTKESWMHSWLNLS